MGILTSRKLSSLNECFVQAGLDICKFQLSTTTADSHFHKPDPRVFSGIKERLRNNNLTAQQALYVGDSIYDFQAARGAGLVFVAVLQGAWTKEEFMQAGLEQRFIIESLGGCRHFWSLVTVDTELCEGLSKKANRSQD